MCITLWLIRMLELYSYCQE